MRLNLIGFNALSKWMNRRYWKKQRADELKREPSMVEMSTPLVDWTDWLNSIDTLDKLTAFMSKLKWRPDPWFQLLHWWRDPVTTVHNGGGDCEDLSLLWYDRLTAQGYKAEIYVCYRKFKWLPFSLPWHFVTVWYCGDNRRWYLSSNTRIEVAHCMAKNGAVTIYCKHDNYSRFRKLEPWEFMGYKEG